MAFRSWRGLSFLAWPFALGVAFRFLELEKAPFSDLVSFFFLIFPSVMILVVFCTVGMAFSLLAWPLTLELEKAPFFETCCALGVAFRSWRGLWLLAWPFTLWSLKKLLF